VVVHVAGIHHWLGFIRQSLLQSRADLARFLRKAEALGEQLAIDAQSRTVITNVVTG